VYIAGRDSAKAAKTIGALKTETGKEAIFLMLDLGNLKSVKAAAEELASKEPAVHILFNNAFVFHRTSSVCTSNHTPQRCHESPHRNDYI
jgi:retinol dehydrogenase-12